MKRAYTVLMIFGVVLIAVGVGLNITGWKRRFGGVVVKQEDIPNAKPPFTGGTLSGVRIRAVAADGSVSERVERPGEEIHIGRGDGVRIWAYPQLGAKMAVKSSEKLPGPADMRDPKTDCLKTIAGTTPMPGESKVGEQKILGYGTIVAVFKSADRSLTNWYAPELGCVSLQTFLEHSSGQTFLVRPKEVVPGPPAKSFFEEPAGLREMRPSEIGIARMKHILKRKGLSDEQIQSEVDQSLARMSPDIKAKRDQQDAQYEAVKLHR